MASVASPPRPVGAAPPPVRHGICRLTLRIGGTEYRVRPMPPPVGFRAVWTLRKLDPHAAPATYSVAQAKGEPAGCTCPDHEQRGSLCKHIMALAALGLLPRPKAARPVKARTRRLHVKNARQAIAEAKALPVEARRHLAEIATALPEGWQPGGAHPSFATGFRSAVTAHVGQLRGETAVDPTFPVCGGCGAEFEPTASDDYSRFVRSQLERTEQLLRLTGADSPAEFDARIECNEEWVKEEAFSRGYAEGRASLQHLLSFCAADHLN